MIIESKALTISLGLWERHLSRPKLPSRMCSQAVRYTCNVATMGDCIYIGGKTWRTHWGGKHSLDGTQPFIHLIAERLKV